MVLGDSKSYVKGWGSNTARERSIPAFNVPIASWIPSFAAYDSCRRYYIQSLGRTVRSLVFAKNLQILPAPGCLHYTKIMIVQKTWGRNLCMPDTLYPNMPAGSVTFSYPMISIWRHSMVETFELVPGFSRSPRNLFRVCRNLHLHES